jgi:hypothetical protein
MAISAFIVRYVVKLPTSRLLASIVAVYGGSNGYDVVFEVNQSAKGDHDCAYVNTEPIHFRTVLTFSAMVTP